MKQSHNFYTIFPIFFLFSGGTLLLIKNTLTFIGRNTVKNS